MIATRLHTAKRIAQEAGELIRHAFGGLAAVSKKGVVDLVTDTDIASERLLREAILAAYPDDAIVAEEGGVSSGSSGYSWLVDPLDGTTNFAHGYPAFSVAIAIVHQGQAVAGVIYQPVPDTCYWAERGAGAFCDARPISVSKAAEIGDGLLATGFPYNRREIVDTLLEKVRRALLVAQGLRRSGSATVDLCHLACGAIDGYWEQDLNPWDWAAGALLVEEAGGGVTDFSGAPYTPASRSVVASNRLLHEALITNIINCGIAPWGRV